MVKIKIIQKKRSNKHNDSVWYDGSIAEVIKENGTILNLIATGEIKIKNSDGEVVFDGIKERNGGIVGGFNSVEDLKKIGNNYDDSYYWDFNNWFEVVFKKKGEDCFDSVICDVAHEYDDGISLLKSYMEDKDY